MTGIIIIFCFMVASYYSLCVYLAKKTLACIYWAVNSYLAKEERGKWRALTFWGVLMILTFVMSYPISVFNPDKPYSCLFSLLLIGYAEGYLFYKDEVAVKKKDSIDWDEAIRKTLEVLVPFFLFIGVMFS